jgi:hypothetical protein
MMPKTDRSKKTQGKKKPNSTLYGTFVKKNGNQKGTIGDVIEIPSLKRRIRKLEKLVELQKKQLTEAQQLSEQLQKQLHEQQLVNQERAKSNDAAIAVLGAKQDHRLLTYEVLQGQVIAVTNNQIVVRLEADDDVIDQIYHPDQFVFGILPKVGDRLTIQVHVTLAPPSLPANHKPDEFHDQPYIRQNVVTGDIRF